MEFYQDLLKPTKKIKSKLGLFLLLALLVIMIAAQVFISVKSGMVTNWFNIIFWSLYGIIALYQIITGKRIDSLFGKAYIQITDKALKLKPSVLKKEQLIYWKNLSHLSMKPTFIKVTGQDGNTISLDFKNFEYQVVQGLKDAVKALIDEGKIKTE